MTDVIVTNPGLSAGQKIGIALSFLLAYLIFWVVYKVGAPRG